MTWATNWRTVQGGQFVGLSQASGGKSTRALRSRRVTSRMYPRLCRTSGSLDIGRLPSPTLRSRRRPGAAKANVVPTRRPQPVASRRQQRLDHLLADSDRFVTVWRVGQDEVGHTERDVVAERRD